MSFCTLMLRYCDMDCRVSQGRKGSTSSSSIMVSFSVHSRLTIWSTGILVSYLLQALMMISESSEKWFVAFKAKMERVDSRLCLWFDINRLSSMCCRSFTRRLLVSP